MNNEIGSYDAKTKLPEILRRVQSGETFTITNRGKAIAELRPSQEHDQVKIQATISNILRMKKSLVSDEQLIELRNSGRK